MSDEQNQTETTAASGAGSELNGNVRQQWKQIDWDDCQACGGVLVAQTTAPDDYVLDGDVCRCVDCGANGYFMVDEDGSAFIEWNCGPSETERYA